MSLPPISPRKSRHAAAVMVNAAPHDDVSMLDCLSLDGGCVLPANNHTGATPIRAMISSTTRTTLDTSLEDEHLDARDDDDNVNDDIVAPPPPSPLSYFSSMLSSAAFHLNSISPSAAHPQTMKSFRQVSDEEAATASDSMQLDCLSLDGCILPSSSSATTATPTSTSHRMVISRKKKDL